MPRDEAYLLDMLLAAQKIARSTHGMMQDQFRRDDDVQDATIPRIQVLGEAARKISDAVKTSHPQIPWYAIVGMRHRLVHDYDRVDLDQVWEAVSRDIPDLIRLLEPLIPPTTPEAT